MLGFGHSWRDGPRHHTPMTLLYFRAGSTPRSEDINVRVNGIPARLCIEADAKRGWARVYIEGPDGELLKDFAGNPRTEFLSGAVEITVG
jgi:hypothetical protein